MCNSHNFTLNGIAEDDYDILLVALQKLLDELNKEVTLQWKNIIISI